MGGSNEVASRSTSWHPPHHFDLRPVDEAAERDTLVVKQRRSIFPSAETVDEQLPAYSENWAGAPRRCWTSRAPCREWHLGA